MGCALIGFSVFAEWGSQYPPHALIGLFFGIAVVLVAGAELLPRSWVVVAGLLRVGGWTLFALTLAAMITIGVVTGSLISW